MKTCKFELALVTDFVLFGRGVLPEAEGLPHLGRKLLATGESDLEVLDFGIRSVFTLFPRGYLHSL